MPSPPRLPPAIDAQEVQDNVRKALLEDVADGDVSAALIAENTTAHARVITREAGVWCGVPWVEATLAAVDDQAEIRWHVGDGDLLEPNQTLFEAKGRARSLLTAERTMLNFAQLLSGTATVARRYADLIRHTSAHVLDTRKTVPGLRLAQKYAVLCGGGWNHRIGLYDAYLLKENHIMAAGSITQAVAEAQRLRPGLPVEVEVETIEQMEEAIAAGAETVMLDNFDLERTRQAVVQNAGRVQLEASGNVDEDSIAAIAETGVDFISSGAITKEVRPLDLSMRFI